MTPTPRGRIPNWKASLSTKSNLEEIARHHADRLDWDPESPKGAVIRFLVESYIEQHEDDFEVKVEYEHRPDQYQYVGNGEDDEEGDTQ